MSDNTCLAAAHWEAGVVSYYGGQLMNQIATPGALPAYTERYLRRALFESALGRYESAETWTDDVVPWSRADYTETDPDYEPAPDPTWVVPDGVGEIDGRVWGGCLAVLRWLAAADRHVPKRLDGAVLAIETAEDLPEARRVRWTLRALGERGLLRQVDAVLVGRPRTRNRSEDPGPEARETYRREQREAVEGTVRRYNPSAPIVFDLDFGHTTPTLPLPIGGRIVVDPGGRSIRFPSG
jgi:muramoyltetrapeptide carboxypeptidase LdcA involved in peptidoglycan recycling